LWEEKQERKKLRLEGLRGEDDRKKGEKLSHWKTLERKSNEKKLLAGELVPRTEDDCK
jgi:hypothetical protein